MLDQIRIVLINTSHPGNIGSVARAMKTMGLRRLYLVNPKQFPHPKAVEMASGACDLLDEVTMCATLDEAIADCTVLFGTSARERTVAWPALTPREMAEKIKAHHHDAKHIAILFGCEQFGLTNEELGRCHFRVQIPANPEYSSLNLAQAVQVLAYELHIANLEPPKTKNVNRYDRLSSAFEMEKFFEHLQTLLIKIEFLKLRAPKKLMARLRRLFLRSQPDVREMNILRGLLSAIDEKLEKDNTVVEDANTLL